MMLFYSRLIIWEQHDGKFLGWLKERIKHWTKPESSVLIIGILSDLTRSHSDLIVENALLRQQLIVLKRQIKRAQLTNPDRFLLVFLSHFTKFWKQALVLATWLIRQVFWGKTPALCINEL